MIKLRRQCEERSRIWNEGRREGGGKRKKGKRVGNCGRLLQQQAPYHDMKKREKILLCNVSRIQSPDGRKLWLRSFLPLHPILMQPNFLFQISHHHHCLHYHCHRHHCHCWLLLWSFLSLSFPFLCILCWCNPAFCFTVLIIIIATILGVIMNDNVNNIFTVKTA